MYQRILIVFIFGFSSGLPLALVTTSLQAWFTEAGRSVMYVGSLSLLGLVYILRIFWVALLDRYTILPLGKRRGWIVLTQVILLFGFNAMAWGSPQTSPAWLVGIALLLSCASATQDMAIEAYRAEYLLPKEQGLGSFFSVSGYRLGLIISGGGGLAIADYIGWANTYRIFGLLMGIGIITTCYCPEPTNPKHDRSSSVFHSFLASFKELLARPYFTSLLFFILLYKSGEAFTSTTSGIMIPFLMQGLGFSSATIGYVNQTIGIFAIVSGGLVAGVLLLRWSLIRALTVFGLIQALANGFFLVLAINGKNITLLITATVADNFAAGLGSTALVALIMRYVDLRYTATQLAFLTTLATLPRVLSGFAGAYLQLRVGWVGLYQISVLLALSFLPFLYRIRAQIPAS